MRSFAAILILSIVGCGQSEQGSQSPPPTYPAFDPAKAVTEISADHLFDAYLENPIAADARYKNKPIRITGYVTAVGKDKQGRQYVGLGPFVAHPVSPEELAKKSPREQKWLREGYPPNVICYVDPAKQAEFAKVKPKKLDSDLIVVGLVQGERKDPNVRLGVVVTVANCVVAPGYTLFHFE